MAFHTVERALDADTLPMRLYEKAKQLGVWNPSEIDFSQDCVDWLALPEDQADAMLQTTSLFVAGEEAVTLDLLPLVLAIAREGRLEEELFLTTFLFEEGKHTQFFRRFLDEAAGSPPELDRWITPSYRTLFMEELPRSMNALLDDRSPVALALVEESFWPYPDQETPFGITLDQVVGWATSPFQKRHDRIERSRGRPLAAVEAEALAEA